MNTPRKLLLTTLALTLPLAGAQALPHVPGATTSTYATVTDPLALSFGADGALYVGRDNSGSGGGNPDAVKIHRVGPGGSPVTEFGNAAIPDPDAVIVDRSGAISGIVGAVLVGGQTSPGVGAVWRIAPDGTVTTLFGPSSLYNNTCGFAFDSAGRLLFTDGAQGRVYRTDGGTPVLMFSLPDAYFIATDAADRIVVSPANNPGRLVLYSSSGVLLNTNFATVRPASPLARGPGGFWTTDLYAITAGGNLVRVALDGTTTTLGSGFNEIEALTFGPDGTLYASDFGGDRIWRIAPLGVSGANGFWGLKTHDPLSQSPTTMFWFDENGAGYRELPRVTVSGVEIEADGLAMSPRGDLFAFQVNTGGGSRLLSLNPTNAVATAVGPVLAGRNIRGATFTLSGRLLAFDYAQRQLIEVNPATGLPVGSALPLSTNVDLTTTAGDLTQMPDGTLVFAYHECLFRLDARTGQLTPIYCDPAPLPDGYAPFCCGIACVPGSAPADRLFGYETSLDDSVYSYAPSTNFARTLLLNNVVPGYNAGRGDLAGLPAARVEIVSIKRSGANVTLETVCRGGTWAEVLFTEDLTAPNWQVMPGTAGWVPYTTGTLATPMTWTNLPASGPHGFFRVRVN